MGSTERDLVRRVLAGDERAFTEFFDGYFPALFRFALARLGRNEDAAEEVVQAALAGALRKLGTYRGDAALSTWLCTFCRHEIADYWRRERRHPATVQLVEDDPDVAAALDALAAATEAGQDAAIRRDETTRLVHVVLDRLPPRYAAVLEWKYLDGMSVNEIAQRMEATSKATESTLTRAREAFREGIALLTRGRPGGERA